MQTGLRLLIGLVFCLVQAEASAQADEDRIRSRVVTQTAPAPATVTRPQSAQPAAPAVTAAPAVPADSTVDDLQRIVVLCATDPEAEALPAQWAAYVEEHAVTAEELDPLIADILRRAAALRRADQGQARARRLAADPATTQKMLHDTAMAVIRKIG